MTGTKKMSKKGKRESKKTDKVTIRSHGPVFSTGEVDYKYTVLIVGVCLQSLDNDQWLLFI